MQLPKATQVIFVKMVTRPTGVEQVLSEITRPRLISGVVQVYESTNKDALKEIEVKSTLCPTYELFRQSCLAANLESLLINAQVRDLPPSHVNSPREVLNKPAKSLLPPNSPAKKSQGTAMKLSANQVDLGAIDVSASAKASFNVSNLGKLPLHFIVIRPLQEKGKKGKKQMVQQHEA
eukprot:COSAG06_NODE_30860_length_531_cov_0.812500_1_plen_177_part_11